MCCTIYMTIVCALQTVSRVILTVLFAIEDLLKLVIHVIHNYISGIIHACAAVPVLVALCFAKKCCCCWYSCCNTCNTSACRRHSVIGCCDCSCIFAIIFIAFVIFAFYYHICNEDLFRKIKSKASLISFAKGKERAINKMKYHFNVSRHFAESFKSKICEFIHDVRKKTGRELFEQTTARFHEDVSYDGYILRFIDVNKTSIDDLYDYVALKKDSSPGYYVRDNLTDVSKKYGYNRNETPYDNNNEIEQTATEIYEINWKSKSNLTFFSETHDRANDTVPYLPNDNIEQYVLNTQEINSTNTTYDLTNVSIMHDHERNKTVSYLHNEEILLLQTNTKEVNSTDINNNLTKFNKKYDYSKNLTVPYLQYDAIEQQNQMDIKEINSSFIREDLNGISEKYEHYENKTDPYLQHDKQSNTSTEEYNSLTYYDSKKYEEKNNDEIDETAYDEFKELETNIQEKKIT